MSFNKKAALKANIQAIQTLFAVEKEHRLPSDAERKLLSAYRGWGGLSCILRPCDTEEDRKVWTDSEIDLFPLVQELKQTLREGTLSEREATGLWEGIKASVLTSFYTDQRIVGAIGSALSEEGIQVERMLDPSAGMGVFAQCMALPTSEVLAYEKDKLTGRILRSLKAHEAQTEVRILGFEEIPQHELGRFDLVASNIPFGNFVVYDRAYSKQGDSLQAQSTRQIHNYFFVKGLEAVREGGLLAYITSQGVLDSPRNEAIRCHLMENARLVSALRLPSGLFSANAGTEVGSDLIILQKQTGRGITDKEQELFVQSIKEGAITLNALIAESELGRAIATSRHQGTDPYGKPAWEYRHSGTIEEIASELYTRLRKDLHQGFDRGLYRTGSPSKEQAPVAVQSLDLSPSQNAPSAQIEDKTEAPNQVENIPTEIQALSEYQRESWLREHIKGIDFSQHRAYEDIEEGDMVYFEQGEKHILPFVADFKKDHALYVLLQASEGGQSLLGVQRQDIIAIYPQRAIVQDLRQEKPIEPEQETTIPPIHREEQGTIVKEHGFEQEMEDAHNLMPKPIEAQLPKLYATEKVLIGDKVAYARYFFPAGAYTAYLLEYDPKERIGFGVVTTGYEWELGYISLDEMEDINIHGLKMERDLYFEPTALHLIEELKDFVGERYTHQKEVEIAEVQPQVASVQLSYHSEGVDAIALDQEGEILEERSIITAIELPEIKQEQAGVSTSIEASPQLQIYEAREVSNIEPPRLVADGGVLYFDEDMHPVLHTLPDDEDALQGEEALNAWYEEVERFHKSIPTERPKEETSTKVSTETRATEKPPKQASRGKKGKRYEDESPSLFDMMFEEEAVEEIKSQIRPPASPPREAFDSTPRLFLSEVQKHWRDGSLVLQNGQVGYLSGITGAKALMFHPLDLPIEQKHKLQDYIQLRDTYHELYHYEASREVEAPELRAELNKRYDSFVLRYGHLNSKKNNQDLSLDTGAQDIFFLEHHQEGKFVKADIFSRPTAFSINSLTEVATPLEALSASLNKYGVVNLPYMQSLLPETDEAELLTSLKGRIYYNPLEENYEVAERFISGDVITKAEQVKEHLRFNSDEREVCQEALEALRQARPAPIPFADLDFNLGERWIPSAVYEKFATELLGTEVTIKYNASGDEYFVDAREKRNFTIMNTYFVKGEFRSYNGLNLLKHALHNTIPEITKNKVVRDPITGEEKTVKVRDGVAIQKANTKIEEIREQYVAWLSRQSENFKTQLADRYNRLFNCFVRPQFDGSHQSFPDLQYKNLGFSDLYPSQKDAIWMIKTNGGGIVDHEVVRP